LSQRISSLEKFFTSMAGSQPVTTRSILRRRGRPDDGLKPGQEAATRWRAKSYGSKAVNARISLVDSVCRWVRTRSVRRGHGIRFVRPHTHRRDRGEILAQKRRERSATPESTQSRSCCRAAPSPATSSQRPALPQATATMTRPKINHRSEAMCVRRRRRLTHEPTAYDFPGDLYGQDPI
jgi:hypothetical protein